MRFFKLVEIDEEEYIERTRDLDFEYCASTVTPARDYPDDKNIYVAIDESEEEIRIDECYFNGEMK